MNVCILMLFFICLLFGTSQALANTIKTDHVEIRLIASDPLDFSKPVQLGVHFAIEQDWHIYWKNPGDSGAAPKFQGIDIEIAGLSWPYPKRIPVTELTNYGYEEDAVIFVDLMSGRETPKLKLEWLVCKIDCIPGFATIPLGQEHVKLDRALFKKFKERLPGLSDWSIDFVFEEIL